MYSDLYLTLAVLDTILVYKYNSVIFVRPIIIVFVLVLVCDNIA